jgi:hypothetical protein
VLPITRSETPKGDVVIRHRKLQLRFYGLLTVVALPVLIVGAWGFQRFAAGDELTRTEKCQNAALAYNQSAVSFYGGQITMDEYLGIQKLADQQAVELGCPAEWFKS